MNKKNIFTMIFILLIIIIIGIIINKMNKNIEGKTIINNISKTNNITNDDSIKIPNSKIVIDKSEKIDNKIINDNENNILNEEDNNINKKNNIFNHYEINGLITEGNTHLVNNEYILALGKYIRANKQDKNNLEIVEKIAKTYFAMKKWEKAYKNYNKLYLLDTSNNKLYLNNYILSNLYSTYINGNKSYSGVINDINKLDFDSELKFYYTNSIYCILDFNKCEDTFYKYVSNPNFQSNIVELANIKQAFVNYENFQYPEEYYKKTLLIGEFFKKDLYPVVIILGERILENKKGYKPILKMLAQSYYEIGNVEKTKKYLLEYNNLDNQDADVSYLLGLVYQKSHEYLLSNIFLSKAIKLGYSPKSNIYKIQIYNSYILKDDKKILTYLDRLIESQETPIYNDLILATYYNLIKGDLEQADIFTKLGLQLYPNKADFYGFDGFIKLKNLEYSFAEKSLKKGYQINKNNAFLNMTYGLFKKEIGENKKAMIYFSNALKLDLGGEISKISLKELNKLKEIENKSINTDNITNNNLNK